jgi:hypothetical protein
MTVIYGLFGLFLLTRVGKIKTFLIHLKDFIYWISKDIASSRRKRKLGIKDFKPYGLKMFTGRQGCGKTVSLVNMANDLHKEYPKALIYSNFDYLYANGRLESLNDLLTIRNGDDGVIFLLDEIQNEFSSNTSRDFPESLLSTITMQRKQKIVILASSQVFTRVSKPLREQCFEVIECKTFMGRWTKLKCYDADDYNYMIDNSDPKKKYKTPKKYKRSYIQTDTLRNCYDTYEVIGRLSRQGFAPKYRGVDNYGG